MPYVNYIELNVPDSKRAAEFFKKAFGWDAQGWGESDYMVVDNGDEAGIGAGFDKMKDGDNSQDSAMGNLMRAACQGLAEGDACSFSIGSRQLDGVCTFFDNGSNPDIFACSTE